MLISFLLFAMIFPIPIIITIPIISIIDMREKKL